ncbi:MAG: hypothetical protein K2Y40_17305, partial [Reyranella sp.]|nr:hypothetical protein [Reyranella sp.]
MNRSSSAAALAAALLFGPIAAGHADDGRAENGRAEEQRLLGDDHEAARFAALLPFARQIAAGGVVSGSLEESTARAGVPAAVMLEALQALATSLDPGRDVRDGDRFHVRYEQSFTAADAPIGVGRLLWLELRTAAKGTVAIHRFRTRDGSDRFWLANGQAATPPSLRLPVEIVSISSGFGLRADPFARPPP